MTAERGSETTMIRHSDEFYMERALTLADCAAEQGEVPVGALVVSAEGQVIAEAWNQPISSCDPTAHAEVVALRIAARQLGNYRLPGCTLYVTIEPCTMCVGALVHSRIDRLVFGAHEPKAGSVMSQARLLDAEYWNHRVQYQGGVCAEQASNKMSEFFRRRRAARRDDWT